METEVQTNETNGADAAGTPVSTQWLSPREVKVDSRQPFAGIFPPGIAAAVLVVLLAHRRRNTWEPITEADGAIAIIDHAGELPDVDPNFNAACAEGWIERQPSTRRLAPKTLDLIACARDPQYVRGGVTLTVADFQIGERVEVFFTQGSGVRRWVPATVIGFLNGRYVDVMTQWGRGNIDPTKVLDENLDAPLIRKMTTPEPSIRSVYEAEIMPLIRQLFAICERYDIPMVAAFQMVRNRNQNDLMLTTHVMRATCDRVLWSAVSALQT